jgi:hypothetical protein
MSKSNFLFNSKLANFLLPGLIFGSALSGCTQADSPVESKTAGHSIINLYKKWGDRAVEGLLDNAEKRVESDRKFQEDLDRKLLDGKISHEEYLKIRATKSEAEQKEVGDAVESLIIMQKKQLELIEKIKQNRK